MSGSRLNAMRSGRIQEGLEWFGHLALAQSCFVASGLRLSHASLLPADMQDGTHYGPKYSSILGLPWMTNVGLASKQHAINPHALNIDECRRLYEATLQILKEKESARHQKK